jgi:predicted phosphodiesterase
MRIFAISDLHVDFARNLEQVRSLSSTQYSNDALILAGDVSHRLEQVEVTLARLTACFSTVFFTPGNHDLWAGDGTSLDQLDALESLCTGLGVQTVPTKVGDCWVVPLYGWYESVFAERLHAEAPADRLLDRWTDYHRCRWPQHLSDDDARCEHFARLNRWAPSGGEQVVSFSHFLPRPELLPRVENLRFKELPRVAGTQRLDDQLRAAGSVVHVFGHTHIPWDETIEGVRYVQNPLAYPHERQRRGQDGIKLVRVW